MLLTVPIPESSICVLKPGQTVEFGTVFLKTQVKNEVTIPVAKELRVTPSKIFHHLKKFVGEPVKKGEILAVKQGLFSTRKMVSEHEGTLKEIDHTTGAVTLLTDAGNKDTVKAYFRGEVTEVKKDHLKIKVKNGKEYALKKADQDFGGETLFLSEDTGVFSDPRLPGLGGKIIVAESLSTYLETKFEAVGVRGVVCLKSLSVPCTLPAAMIKQIDDFKKIVHDHFPYCLIDRKYSRIYLYE